MRRIHALLLLLLAFVAQPTAAQVIAYEDVTAVEIVWLDIGGTRFLQFAPAQVPQGIAAYGPFRVTDSAHAALVEVTDETSPEVFAAMLRDYPRISVLTMISCPGTEDDRANLRLGLMIRERGIATYAPDGGLIASGAVDLFLAGVRRYAEPGARFIVHSWQDTSGLEPRDYPINAPKNRAYIDYYRTVGLSLSEARAFYAMTNSVPFAEEKWLTPNDLAEWVRLDSALPLPIAALEPHRPAIRIPNGPLR